MKCALVALAVLAAACSSRLPTQPDAAVFDESAPFTLSVYATAGTGANGGTASIVARVQNGHGTNLPNVVVTFTTDVGTLSSASAATLPDGTATLSLTAATAATITATVGPLTTRALVQSNPHVPIVPPVPDGPPPPPPGPPAPGPLTVTLLVTPGLTGSATIFGLQSPGITRAVWTFGDGASLTTTIGAASHVYATAGTYTASVTITDTIGRTASNSQAVAIADPPPPPAPSYDVTLKAAPASIAVLASTTLTATVTAQHGASPPTSYSWTFGDGTTTLTTVPTTTHMYGTPGTFTAKVTAMNAPAGGSGSTVVTVTAVVALFTMNGTGNTVFTIPTTVTQIHITGTYPGTSSNFIVKIGGATVVNEIIGTTQIPPISDGTYVTTGGQVQITNSSGVAWSFTEVR